MSVGLERNILIFDKIFSDQKIGFEKTMLDINFCLVPFALVLGGLELHRGCQDTVREKNEGLPGFPNP